MKAYSKSAGVEDWEGMSPHLLRAFPVTEAKEEGQDALTIRDLMRYKTMTTTSLYVGQSSPQTGQSAKNLASQDAIGS